MKRLFAILFSVVVLLIHVQSWGKVYHRPAEGAVNLPSFSHYAEFGKHSHFAEQMMKTPYEEEIFTLAYTTFLANANVEDAFSVAKSAVNHRPLDISWRRRLAQSALWTDRSGLALQQYIFIAKYTRTDSDIKTAFLLAKGWLYLDSEIEMLQLWLQFHPNDQGAILELAKAQDGVGQPNNALLTLKKLLAMQVSRPALVELANVYQNTDDLSASLKVLNEIEDHYGFDAETTSRAAEIYYNQGKLRQALAELVPAYPSATNKDVEFWRAMGDLSWTLNDLPDAIIAYEHFFSSGKGDMESLRRLVALLQIKTPELAYSYALKGWGIYHADEFFVLSINLGVQLRDWPRVENLFVQLTNKQRLQLQKKPDYWVAQANMLEGLGAHESARLVLQRGIILYPNLTEIKSEYLWFLVREGGRDQLWPVLLAWEPELWGFGTEETLWLSYAHALVLVDKPRLAMRLYQQHLLSGGYIDNEWFIFYAEALEDAKLFNRAYQTRLSAWYRFGRQLINGNTRDIEVLRGLDQLAVYFASGDAQYPVMAYLTTLNRDRTDGDILLTWAVEREDVDLVKYLRTYYFDNNLPNWAELNLAILLNDQLSMQNLLKHAQNLPREDRVTAAERLEYYPLAQTLIYQGLSDEPTNQALYEQFTDTMLESANDADIAEEFEQFGIVNGPRTVLTAKYFLTPRWSILPFASDWLTKGIDQNQITNVPGEDTDVGIAVQERIHRGTLGLAVSERNNLDNFMTAAGRIEYQVSSQLEANFKLGYNQPSLENSYMRVGGVEDQAILNLEYKFTERDLLESEFAGKTFLTQNQHYLADGFYVREDFSHKFWLSYPDYTAGVFGEVHVYNKNGSLGGDIVNLFPNSLTPTFTDVIPNSFSELGVNFSFGDLLRTSYTDQDWRPHASVYSHEWRPYGLISLYYSSAIHIGNEVEGGITGSVFGRDNLAFYANRSSAPSASGQVDYIVGARYRIFF